MGSYYSGAFLSGGLRYGNGYYPGISFPTEMLQKYGVSALREMPVGSGSVTAMSAPVSGLVGEWLLNGDASDTS